MSGLQGFWRDLVERPDGRLPKGYQMFMKAWVVRWDGDMVEVSVPGGLSDFERILEGGLAQALEAALSDWRGETVGVKIVKADPRPPLPTVEIGGHAKAVLDSLSRWTGDAEGAVIGDALDLYERKLANADGPRKYVSVLEMENYGRGW